MKTEEKEILPLATDHETSIRVSPFSIPNIRLFIMFRVFMNSRFYYPVFTILFLDFGLSIAQFSVLNAVWAATIVLTEVPSGALADLIGRRRLLIFAASVMTLEIGVISFAPASNPDIVFVFFLVNRVLSGLGEAAASGADEAIAYDSLKEKGNSGDWGRVLEILTRWQSIGFILAMGIGAAIYDPKLMRTFTGFLGYDSGLTQQDTMRLPLYLTLVLAFLSLWTAFKMKDPGSTETDKKTRTYSMKEAFHLTFQTGGWILKTPFVLTIILFGMIFDGTVRVVVTLSSQYYRVIDIPESLFGLLGAAVSGLGFIIPKMARKLAENKSPAYGLYLTAMITISGLVSMCFFRLWWGIIPSVITFSSMYFTGFFVSYYINRETPSETRATVLSFKGLLYNISYGFLGIGYALVLKAHKEGMAGTSALNSLKIENTAFIDTFLWFPVTFAVLFLLTVIVYFLWLREKNLTQ
ncbi:MAG: MFS transporter [Deltaproteobacteria bacterium]|nr:MFS transporter [Deltaproteobacteria bacterium]